MGGEKDDEVVMKHQAARRSFDEVFKTRGDETPTDAEAT
jgi:hypothetical protein